jgi:hypothetical protein
MFAIPRSIRRALISCGAGLALAALPAAAQADVVGTNFESSSYHAGDVDGQGGWSKTGPYDATVENLTSFPDAAGYGFATKALRISNSVTSSGFSDQTFSPSLVDEAGESGSSSGGFSGGIRQPHFDARFRIGSTQSTEHADPMTLYVSPDRGDGARMTYLRFEDAHADGIHVIFKDLQGVDPGTGVANFVDEDIATLSRSTSHQIEFSIDFNEGPANDVVKIYIDGALVKTGATWEEYYRHDPEQAGGGNKVPTTDSLIFRAAGTAQSGNAGKGLLIDDVRLESDGNPPAQGAVGNAGAAGPQGPQGQAGAYTAGAAPSILPSLRSFPAILGSRWKMKGNRLVVPVECPAGAGVCEVHIIVKKGRKTLGTTAVLLHEGTTKSVGLRLRVHKKAKGARTRRMKLSATADSRDARGLFTRTERTVAVKG